MESFGRSLTLEILLTLSVTSPQAGGRKLYRMFSWGQCSRRSIYSGLGWYGKDTL